MKVHLVLTLICVSQGQLLSIHMARSDLFVAMGMTLQGRNTWKKM